MKVVIALCSVVLSLGVATSVHAQGGFSFKQDQASVGSNIKRPLIKDSPIPFDKRYSELTPEQQAHVKSQYEGMAPGDEPPFPIDGMMRITRAVSEVHNKLGARGLLSMVVEIDSAGKAVSVSVYQSPDPGMTQAVASILMLEQYKPARCAGVPCKMSFSYRIEFVGEL